ncbi:hypothetical protein An11g04570 [Aspergillus niger]|uniref:Uncharacterized protein n=2 Tax=Aspergillus niger TaxID=5061 RepID=A2QWB6_ASPNC|nr:hypothetical protein An11g04570 [Aspergillus niger]CAK45944.1 hypothetical protein An11g04570 [Aspergillus niger]
MARAELARNRSSARPAHHPIPSYHPRGLEMKKFRSVGSNYPGLYLLGLTTQVAYNVTSLLFALGIGTYRKISAHACRDLFDDHSNLYNASAIGKEGGWLIYGCTSTKRYLLCSSIKRAQYAGSIVTWLHPLIARHAGNSQLSAGISTLQRHEGEKYPHAEVGLVHALWRTERLRKVEDIRNQ